MTTLSTQRAVETATVPLVPGDDAPVARFFIPVPNGREPSEVADEALALLAPLAPTIGQISASAPADLVLTLPGRTFIDATRAFDAGHALENELDLSPVEPDITHTAMPVVHPGEDQQLESVDQFPGCWAGEEETVNANKSWALDRMHVREAWALSRQMRRPAQGEGIVIAQIDTGITDHPELEGVVRAGSSNILGDGTSHEDVADPMRDGTVGHGTGTASVVVSPDSREVVGTAPKARHLPIRAIETVVRLSQTNVAAAVDKAVEMGAHVISMSLGGIWSFALQRALARAVAADVLVLAAAGNCVRLVVWPARFDDCIAVAGTTIDDTLWKGSCRGASVTISAPAQNVWRAKALTGASGQGQGTSFAVALTAGVAACWLAHHGRSTLAAQALQRGETLQSMFRRLLRASARKPGPDWDVFNMGAGIVDAKALLEAELDAGRETETPSIAYASRTEDASLREFAIEAFGEPAAAAPVDWMKYGAQTSLAVLADRRARPGADELESASPPGSAPVGVPAPVIEALAAARSQVLPPREFPTPGLRQARGSAQPKGGDVRRIEQLRTQIIARHSAGETQTSSGSPAADAIALESTVPRDAAMPHPDDILQRIADVARRMPASEKSDPVAFGLALRALFEHGEKAVRKLAHLDRDRSRDVTPDEASSLEALIIADGTRPSFLLAGGLPPEDHPFLGMWTADMSARRTKVQALANTVGRVQPTRGHASKFIGTATMVDTANGLALTNYHVVDDARSVWSVPMIQNGNRLRIPSGLEVDFGGEADRDVQSRFRVVEAILPHDFGRGVGNLDAAVLRLEPLPGAANALPEQTAVLDSRLAFAQGDVRSLIVIGFPGPARPGQFTQDAEVDWAFVTNTLFGNRFGFKRVAPGKFSEPLGFHDGDATRSVFGHDCTTFGGVSGALLAAWEEDRAQVFGLHFGGWTLEANYAIAMAKAAEALRAVGVPVV